MLKVATRNVPVSKRRSGWSADAGGGAAQSLPSSTPIAGALYATAGGGGGTGVVEASTGASTGAGVGVVVGVVGVVVGVVVVGGLTTVPPGDVLVHVLTGLRVSWTATHSIPPLRDWLCLV